LIVLISKDLFFAPVVKSAAEAHELPFTLGLNVDSKNIVDLAAETVVGVIVDLSSVNTESLSDLHASLRTKFVNAKLAAFAPHVHGNKLKSAGEAGFDQVLSRGQLSSGVGSLLQSWI